MKIWSDENEKLVGKFLRASVFKKGSWKRVPNNNQIVLMYYIYNIQKISQKLHIGYSKANYISLHKNGGKIVQFEFGEF